MLHFVLSGIGVFLGFYLGWRVGITNLGFINLFSSTALWFYSTNMKKAYLSGNIIISLLAALTLFIVPMYDIIPNPAVNGESAFYLICFYSIFAFVTTFIREIVKDFEDQFGDSKMGYNTFAIVSAKTAKITVQIISVLLITIIGWISYLQITYDELYAAIYVLLSIELPLVYFFIKLRTASDKKTYHQLSQLIKLIMLTGTLSILVFTLLF